MRTKLLTLAAATAVALGSITGCSTTTTSTPSASKADPMAKRQAIDSNVDAALSRIVLGRALAQAGDAVAAAAELQRADSVMAKATEKTRSWYLRTRSRKAC